MIPEGLRREALECFSSDLSGHDAAHTQRVIRLALTIARAEGADRDVVELAALLHDVDDEKLTGVPPGNLPWARRLMAKFGYPDAVIDRVCRIIGQVSFKGVDSVVPDTIEGKIVQDADRLDAIGAVGIARAFTYGGSRGRVMHDPDVPPALGMDAQAYRQHRGTTVNHFYEKLLLLRDQMNTPAARRLAEERHQFMLAFLKEFDAEWRGEK